MERLPESEMEDRRVYRIHSRNLVVGAWRAETRGFIGVREKFGSLYLFEEYHSETGPPLGTAVAIEAYDLLVPETVLLAEHLEGEDGFQTNTDLFNLLLPYDQEINARLMAEQKLADAARESRKWRPQTEAEWRREEALKPIQAWRRGEVDRIFALPEDDRREANKAMHQEWQRRLKEAIASTPRPEETW